MIQIQVSTPEDFSFRETLEAHGWRRLAPFQCEDDLPALSRVERLSDGSVVNYTVRSEADRLNVEISAENSMVADSSEYADEITAKVRTMLQLDVDVSPFHAFCHSLPHLSHIPGKRQGRLLRSPTLWEDCCKVILTTNTTWKQTIGMTQRLVDTFGSGHPSNMQLKAFPTPQQVAAASYAEFEQTARFGYRNRSIHSLAVSITEGELDLERICYPGQTYPELWKRLTGLRGIGPYAASCLMIYLGRYERVNVDSWARMMVSQELGRDVSDREVHEFFAPYGEWCGLVYHFYPWKTVEPAY